MEKEKMADSSVSEAVGKLMDGSTEELRLFVGATDELEKLKHTYLSILGIIYDAKQRQVFDYSLQSWLSELEKDANGLYKLLDEYYLISDASSGPIKNKKNELCGCLRFISDYMQDFILRRKMKVQIKKIKKRLDENVYEKERFSSENVYEKDRLSSECISLLISRIFLPIGTFLFPSSSHSIHEQSSESEDSTPLFPYHRDDSPAANATSFRDESEIIIPKQAKEVAFVGGGALISGISLPDFNTSLSHSISEQSSESKESTPLLLSRFSPENVYVKKSSSSEHRYDSPAANATSFRDESEIIILTPGEPDSTQPLPSRRSSKSAYENDSFSSECRYDPPAAIAPSSRDESEIIIPKQSKEDVFLGGGEEILWDEDGRHVTFPNATLSIPSIPSLVRSKSLPISNSLSIPNIPSLVRSKFLPMSKFTEFKSKIVRAKNDSSLEHEYDSPAANPTKQLLLVRLRKEIDEFDRLLQHRLMAAASSGRNKNEKKACDCLYSIVDYVQNIIPRRDEMKVRSKNIRERYDLLVDEVRTAAAGGGQNRCSNQTQ